MTKKNLSLLRRSNNRTQRPARTQSSEEEEGGDEQQQTTTNRRHHGHGRRRASGEDETGKLYVDRTEKDTDWMPAMSAVFKVRPAAVSMHSSMRQIIVCVFFPILFSMRVSAALWSAISDCDEVYNYWEPLHTLLYGRGFQTWEYSPVYAIRSWLYVYLHFLPAQPLSAILGSSKIAVFISTRCLLGLFAAAADMCLYRAIANRLGSGIARLFIVFSMLSAGMFISSCAFLPSSFSMSLNAFALAAYLSRRWWWSVFATAMSALVGWPFAAVLGLPVVIEMLIMQPRRLGRTFAIYAGIAFAVLTGALLGVDSYLYGRTVLAPLNIVLYNIFSSHGPNLYGVEPMSYYVKNLLLNWNIAFPLSMLAIPIGAFVYWRVWRSAPGFGPRSTWTYDLVMAFWSRFIPVAAVSVTGFLWLAIFFTQAHKEERFLFPVYPILALTAAVTVDAIHRLGMMTFVRRRYAKYWDMAILTVMAFFVICSASRAFAVHRNFAAPLETYKALNEHFINEIEQRDFHRDKLEAPVRVCVGKEWYRFPSSFFLPNSVTDRGGHRRPVQLDFVRSEFAGLLPKPFPAGKLPAITRQIPTEMNDMNREEPSRYVDVAECDYMIDLETPDVAPLEPNYAQQPGTWRSLGRAPFLLASRSHWFFRAFYVPVLSNRHCTFGRYHVLQRMSTGNATGMDGDKP